jgi:hypothetical protein
VKRDNEGRLARRPGFPRKRPPPSDSGRRSGNSCRYRDRYRRHAAIRIVFALTSSYGIWRPQGHRQVHFGASLPDEEREAAFSMRGCRLNSRRMVRPAGMIAILPAPSFPFQRNGWSCERPTTLRCSVPALSGSYATGQLKDAAISGAGPRQRVRYSSTRPRRN